MMQMRIPFFKSRKEREFERRLKYRRIVRGLEAHLKKLQQTRQRFRDLLKEAVSTHNDEATNRYARACGALDERINRVQRQKLAVEGIQAVGEMVSIDRDFAEFAREMGRAMSDTLAASDIQKFEADLERGIMRAEEIDALLDDVVGNMSDGLVGFGATTDDACVKDIIDEVIAEDETEQQENRELEQSIAEELAEIKDSLGEN